MPHKDGWSVRREGAQRAAKVVRGREKAISYARGIVLSSGSTGVTVHKVDGTIHRRMSATAIKRKRKVGTTSAKKK